MGTSVINPMIFYWMDVVSDIEVLLVILTIVLAIVWLCIILWNLLDGNELDEFIKPLIAVTIPLVLCGILTALIPSKDTMLTMLVADMITYENIELTKESAMALVNYIVEQVKVITG